MTSPTGIPFFQLVAAVEEALKGPLPGAPAHALLAPRPRREWPAGFDAALARDAAGLLLLFPVDGRAHIVLTVRSNRLGRHGGQISLPGGAVEPGETFEQAALREAREEIGLATDTLRLLGALSPVDIPVSGFTLHPIVASTPERPSLTPADGEVAAILEVAVDALVQGAAVRQRQATGGGPAVTTPMFLAGGAEVWGATAMVLSELLALLGWMGPVTKLRLKPPS